MAGLAVGVTLLVAGCTDGSSPKPSPLPSVTASSSSAATPSAPAMPAEAKGTSAASAKAFVRYWIETLNFAGSSGATARLREASTPECAACTGIAEFIDRVYTRGGSISGDGWGIRQIRLVDRGPGRGMTVDALVDVAPQEVVKRKGGKSQHFNGGRRLKTFLVTPRQNSWHVARLDQPE